MSRLVHFVFILLLAAKVNTPNLKSTYYPALDLTDVTLDVGPLKFSYGYEGKVQRGIQDDVGVAITTPASSVVFAVDGQRTAVRRFGRVKTQWLQSLVDAKKVDFTLHDRGAQKNYHLIEEQRAEIRQFIDRTGYNSEDAVTARRQAAADEKRRPDINVVVEDRRELEKWEQSVAAREFFAPPESPRGVVYVLDRSGSMIDKMSAAVSIIQLAADALPQDTPFNVIACSDETKTMSPRMAKCNEAGYALMKQWLADLGTTGIDTAMTEGMAKALRYNPSLIVLLTDGELSEETMKSVVRLTRGDQVKVNVTIIQTRDDAPNDLLVESEILREFAESTGGGCKAVKLEEGSGMVHGLHELP